MNRLRKILNSRYVMVFFLTLVAIWFFCWVLYISTIPSSLFGGPDEGLRYLVPKFIFENGRLPTGYDTATIHSMGNWSYAFYPQFLGSLVSAFFILVVSIFNHTPEGLIYAARMASVVFGVITVLFVGKSVEKVFKGNKNAKVFSFLAMGFVAAWPQLAFLSAYTNNDIVALSGVSVIVYACIAGYKDHWNATNVSILAIGMVICLLGYVNSYGFVLFGGLFFLVSLWWQADEKKYPLKLVGLATGIVLISTGPLFIRNAVIYQGDVFGISSFREETLKWESQTGRDAQKSYTDISGHGLLRLIGDEGYRQAQLDSAIARFGKMTVAPEDKYMNVYRSFAIIGVIGFLWMLLDGLARSIRSHRRLKDLKIMIVRHKTIILLIACILASCLTTLALSLYYSLMIDFQPQGRYIICLLVPLVIVSVSGFYYLIEKIIVRKYQLPTIVLLAICYLLTTLIVFYKYVYSVAILYGTY